MSVYGFNENKNKVNIFNAIYPVGSIYMSVDSTNPSTLFGGTWEAWGEGCVPVSVLQNPTQNQYTSHPFGAVERTGGEMQHTLIVNEIPSHDHVANVPVNGTSIKQGTGTVIGETAAHSSNYTGATGGGQAHNNLQPYITCYMWKRTA